MLDKISYKRLFLVFLVSVFIVTIGCFSKTKYFSDGHEVTSEHTHEDVVHIHANFTVDINDKEIDFSVLMYQLKAEHVHLEYGIGNRIHVHKKGVTIGSFLETLGVILNKTCISIPIEGLYCNTENKKLVFYINGIENNGLENYEIKEDDKILISYGDLDKKEI